MNLVLRDVESCAVYLDDVVVYSDEWETLAASSKIVWLLGQGTINCKSGQMWL